MLESRCVLCFTTVEPPLYLIGNRNMCGICGKVYFDTANRVDPALVETMARVLEHRGPDDAGLYVKENIGLGHRRLSIIDLSPAGRQPMTNEDSTVWVVYNGEIYNHEPLRAELESRGHRFASHTDTEVIVHLYEEEGPECVRRLRGMFAFAVWDAPRRQLMLARDRAGKKPLVYANTNGALVFASEIKALLQDPSVADTLNYEAIHHYLTYQYVPGPITVFNAIQKLPPAHYLLLRNGTISCTKYWELSYTPKLRLPRLDDYKERFLALFQDTVNIRLKSDVPLGVFLSGGIDSSATVAVMSSLLNRPAKTFSIGFEDADFNELEYARTVSGLYQTDHTEFIVKPDALSILPALVRQYDEPFADPSAIPTYYVSQLTRRHVTVALNGDGGDESFAGYERYLAGRLSAYYARVPALLRNSIIRPIVCNLPYRDYRWSVVRRLKRFITGAAGTAAQRHVQWLCYFNADMKKDLYTSAFAKAVSAIDSAALTEALFRHSDADGLLDKALYADVKMYLPYDLLVKVDIASMAHSLEARSPFLDHTLMEFAASLPERLKLHGMQLKFLLKKAFAPLLPESILYRKKMGFGVPLNRWFREELKPAARDILLAKRSVERGYFNKKVIARMLDEHAAMTADHSYRLWALLWLELWHRIFVDKSSVLGL